MIEGDETTQASGWVKRRAPRSGFARWDLVITLACIAIVVVIALPALHKARHGADLLKSGTQVKQIHQSMIVWGRDHEGMYPRPGLAHQYADGVSWDLEDAALNTTANLYSLMIMQNCIEPKLCVSIMEKNDTIEVYDDYDYDLYSAARGVYWDPGFKADLAEESHASYAHMVLYGARVAFEWRETFNNKFAVMGERGPVGGVLDDDSVTMWRPGIWLGNICYNDNHIATENSVVISYTAVDAGSGLEHLVEDNLFDIDTWMAGGDMILSFTTSMSEDGPELQHD